MTSTQCIAFELYTQTDKQTDPIAVPLPLSFGDEGKKIILIY